MLSYPDHSVQITSLKDLGYFAKISFSSNKSSAFVGNEVGVSNSLLQSKIIFVVDRSGSMGQHFSAIISNVIPLTLVSLGFPSNYLVDIVTFDSFLDATTTSIEALKKDTRTARGSTYMALVFDKLFSMIHNAGNECPMTVVVISDGEIMDKPQTLTEASRVSAKISRSAPISVIPIRLLTGPSANPDTQALAAVALLNSSGPVPLIEHNVFSNKEVAYGDLSKLLVQQLRKTVTSYGSIVADKDILRSVPQSQGHSKMALTSKVNFIIIDPNADLSAILVNGKPLIASKDDSTTMQVLQDEQEIQPFLEFILSWLKVRMVVGQTEGHFQAVVSWFQRLQTIMDNAGSLSADGAGSNVLLRDRIAFVKKALRKRSLSLMNEVLQFSNASRLDNLNSNQLADYLRSNVKSKATARRMEKFQESSELSWKEQAQILLKKLSAAYDKIHNTAVNTEGDGPAETSQEVTIDEIANGIISFFSQATAEESLFAARDFLDESDLENVEIFDLLQLSGGLGLCFNAQQSDLPDPWQYQVNEVYVGNYFLSEADIRTSKELAISYPGSGEGSHLVTGVLPLMKLNKSLYEMYNFGELKLLSELQASVTMRGVLGAIPYDVLAMNAAVLFKIMTSIPVKENASALQIELISSLKTQISAHIQCYAKNSFAGIAKALACDADPRPFLIGANDANAVLKLFCIVVGHEVCQGSEMTLTQLSKVMAILYDMAAYTSAKHHFRRVEYLLANGNTDVSAESAPKSRQAALMELLQIDLEEFRRNSDVGKPFEPDPEFTPSVEVNVEACLQNLPDWMPSASKFAAIYRWLRPLGEEPLATAFEAFGCKSTAEFHVFKLWVAANATFCGDEDARIDKEKNIARSCLPNDIPEVIGELQAITDKICKRDFDSRLAQKRAQESSLALQSLLSDLLQCESEEEFITLLNTGNHYNLVTIRDRSSAGYETLMQKLTTDDGKTIPIHLRFKKLAILLTGRIVTTGEVVWNNGNVLRQYLTPFNELFTKSGKSELWASVATCISENTKHTYRVGPHNRHDHGEDKPSYYALGFPSLAAFEDACKSNTGCYSMKDWNAYVAVHTYCCGFGKIHLRKK